MDELLDKVAYVLQDVEGHLLVQVPRASLSHHEEDLEDVDQIPLALVVEKNGRLTTIETDVRLQLLLGLDEQLDGELLVQVEEDADREALFDERRLEWIVGRQVLDLYGVRLDLFVLARIARLKTEENELENHALIFRALLDVVYLPCC